MKKIPVAFAIIIVLLALSVGLLQQCKPTEKQPSANSFVGDASCKSCHADQYKAWLGSDHYKAMLPANDSTVEGDFNNTTFTAEGVTSRFYKKNGSFYINTIESDGTNNVYKVLYTFGYYPLQQYLVAFPKGRMQVSRASWDVKKKKWFHQYEGQKIASADWLHWTKDAQNWNTMCAACHSTNLQKNYNIEADSFHTTWSVINVSCESCHGPGKNHIDFINSSDYKDGHKVDGSYLKKVKEQVVQLNTCAPCHALKSDISVQPTNPNELLDDYIPEIPTTEHYFADGQMKDEDYIYSSFVQSKMFHRGVKCSNCHDPHTSKTRSLTNQLCTNCHAKTYDDPSHHFHGINTEGAACKNCHMPGRFYMGNDFRHDHSLRVPRPDLSVKYGTPNACNDCHKDKTAKWAADAVVKWYGDKRKYHFSEDLIPGSKLDGQSEGHLTKLVNDTSVPAVIRSAANFYLGSILTPGSANALKRNLQDPNAIVRYHALRGLANFPYDQWLTVAAPLLSDKVRAVRIAAADLFVAVPASQLPQEYTTAFTNAKGELERYLYYQADFSVGNVMLGDYFLKLNDLYNAQKFYTRGLKKDSLMNYARLNLSTVYNAQGKNKEALEVLKVAAMIDPKNERIFYNMALLYNEMNDTKEALKNFDIAYQLRSSNSRMYYNYGLLLFKAGNVTKAEEVLLKGLSLNENDESLNYAMAYVYIQAGKVDKARKYAATLKRINPNNPEYQPIFNILL